MLYVYFYFWFCRFPHETVLPMNKTDEASLLHVNIYVLVSLTAKHFYRVSWY